MTDLMHSNVFTHFFKNIDWLKEKKIPTKQKFYANGLFVLRTERTSLITKSSAEIHIDFGLLKMRIDFYLC